MRLSQYFIPTLKETPAEAHIASHRLMLRSGMVVQTCAGIYSWLPTGLRVLKKISAIVREEQEKEGSIEVLMATLQPAELWNESGRYEGYGKEMLRFKDRHDRELLYGPTAEEVITDIFRKHVHSYKDLPKRFYNIQWKFRDEIRPRFGVMRGREFIMKDNYSFDIDVAGAIESYHAMYRAYLRTFARMGLKAIPVKADPGVIGGDMSHEFQILAETGESALYYDKRFDDIDLMSPTLDLDEVKSLYAAADEMHKPDDCPVPADQLRAARGIEVGHIFYFGTKYSDSMNAKVAGSDGKMITVEMGSYGIGVSRLVGAIIEASHDEHGICWPVSVAPFHVGMIPVGLKEAAHLQTNEDLYNTLMQAGVEVLMDDRDERPGVKFSDMDLIGLPYQLIVGAKSLAEQNVEIKVRKTGERHILSIPDAVAFLINHTKV